MIALLIIIGYIVIGAIVGTVIDKVRDGGEEETVFGGIFWIVSIWIYLGIFLGKWIYKLSTGFINHSKKTGRG